MLINLAADLAANAVGDSNGQMVELQRLLGSKFTPVVAEEIINLSAENYSEIARILSELTVQKVVAVYSSNPEQALLLLENLLVILPELFADNDKLVDLLVTTLQERLKNAGVTDLRLQQQAQLRLLLEQLETKMQDKPLSEIDALRPLVLRLHGLLLDNMQQTTTARAEVEIYAYSEWTLRRGHREGNLHVAPGILSWHQAIRTQLETKPIWLERVQPKLTEPSTAAGAAQAFITVDLSRKDEIALQRLKGTFDAVYRYHLALDEMNDFMLIATKLNNGCRR